MLDQANRSGADFIPMMDPSPLHNLLAGEIDVAIRRVVQSGKFVLGNALETFEAHAADYLGVRHAVGVASGTDALLLSLKAAGVGRGDEVITSPFAFWATVEAIHHAGARAVFADIDASSMNIDPVKIEAAVTPATRALLPVHLFGRCAEMNAILAVAHKYDLPVIEDAAQAFGAKYHGKQAGSFGLAGCFSFHPAKPLGAFGDGGLIATNDDVLAGRLHRLRNHGDAARYAHVEYGYNSRLDDLQAAVLDVKLKHLETILNARCELAARYHELLEDSGVLFPRILPQRRHVFAQYTVRLERRDALKEWLGQQGIASAVHYPAPLYRQPACEREYHGLYLPNTETASRECLSLPLYFGMSPERQQRVADAIRQFRS